MIFTITSSVFLVFTNLKNPNLIEFTSKKELVSISYYEFETGSFGYLAFECLTREHLARIFNANLYFQGLKFL